MTMAVFKLKLWIVIIHKLDVYVEDPFSQIQSYMGWAEPCYQLFLKIDNISADQMINCDTEIVDSRHVWFESNTNLGRSCSFIASP